MEHGRGLGVIGGGGWLGSAIARAAVKSEVVAADRLTLSYRSERGRAPPGASWTRDNQALVDRSDVIVVSVRPADWPAVEVMAAGKLVVSVMAGISIETLAARLGTRRVVRSLPNAAADVGASYTPWIASPEVTDEDKLFVRRLMSACGTEDEVRHEHEMDYFTGLSGSGPAFPALLAAAMMGDAVSRGIAPKIARRAVDAVMVGAGRLVESGGDSPADTVETFVAYRGTTAAAIEAMQAAGFKAAISAGLAAAGERSRRMSQQVGRQASELANAAATSFE